MQAYIQGTTRLLAGPFDAGALAAALPGHRTVEDAADPPRPFRLLDSFDGAVRGADQALIESGGRWLVVTGAGAVLAAEVPKGARRLADLPEGPVRDALSQVSALRSFRTLAEGRMASRRIGIVDEEGKTVARLDLLALTAGGAEVTLMALRALRGYGAAFRALAAALPAAGGPGEITARLAPGLIDPKPQPVLPDDPTAADVAHAIIRAGLVTMRETEAGIVEDRDTEYLHDHRVALRRIRAVVGLFQGVWPEETRAELKAGFGALMARTGRLRDLDVYLLDRAAFFDLVPASLHPGLDLLFARFAKDRAAERRALARWLQSPDYAAARDGLAAHFNVPGGPPHGPEADTPALPYASALLWRRYRKTVTAAAAIGPETPDEEVHELRIHAKKLRYLLEAFAPVFGPKALRPLVKPLKALQEELGLFNDASVQRAALQAIPLGDGRKAGRDKAGRGKAGRGPGHGKDDLALAASLGALTAVLDQRQRSQRQRVEAGLAQFLAPEVRDSYSAQFRHKGA